jgi:UDP-glucose 4-epimerase
MQDYQESYRGKTILVTGGAGAIGSNLTRALGELGARSVMVLDDLSSAMRWNVPDLPNVVFIEGSILDEAKLQWVFSQAPELVFHLAALFANQNSIEHPETDLLVNGLGTLKLLQYSHSSEVQRFIYASSGASFYDPQTPLPLTEDSVSLHLGTPYQITKMLGEVYCNFFYEYYGLDIVKTRFFNSYGEGEIPGKYRNVIPNFIFWALRGEPLPITGTGEETRDFTYVGDLVDGLLRCGYSDAAVGREFNLASGVETRIIDLAHLINAEVGNDAGIIFTSRRKWDTKLRRWAAIERAVQLLGYKPSTPLPEGLKIAVAWFRTNWDKMADISLPIIK